ncbi:MAG TPA: Ppx/GppA phosphatase family protein [Vicinamibacterales bacterium]|nr:Ppx/GppA phosphatase family protein [Vicinamibacterales bacterium]
MQLAAIDIGTNSIHMIICKVAPDGSFEVIDREKDMIRLGAGSLGGRILPESSLARAMQTLAKFKRLADSHGVEEIIATATSAVREAENGADFIAAARRDVGLRVRVISGTEEARLIHLAAGYAIGIRRQRAVVIDIGGGSTEITLGTAARMELGQSFKLGSIRLTEGFAKHDPLSKADERAIEEHVTRETKAHLKEIRKRGFDWVIGTSGTMLALGAVAAEIGKGPLDVRRQVVRARDFAKLRKRLVDMTQAERLKMPGLDPKRADLAPACSVLIDTVLTLLGGPDVRLCDFALREGLVLDYLDRQRAHIKQVDRYPDVRRRSVIELGERCQYYPQHAEQIARLSLAIFDGLQKRHGLGAAEREWLEYAALLHDIGTLISYESHHKHSYYLIRHGDLRGFDPREVEIIALVARYHRQATPKKSHEGMADLDGRGRDAVRMLGAILRLAEGLDRSHTQVIAGLDVVDGGKEGIVIRLRTAGDAELEVWSAGRHAEALAGELDADIHFAVSPVAAPRRAAAANRSRPAAAGKRRRRAVA